LYAKAMWAMSIMNLVTVVELTLGFEPTVYISHYDFDEWYFQGESHEVCPSCGAVYNIFRCLYLTTQGNYECWAVVCDGCQTAVTLNALPATSKKALRKWDREMRGQIGEKLPQWPIVLTYPIFTNPLEFSMEKYLEEFLIANWTQTVFGKEYDIFVEDGEIVGRQYHTAVGRIDILAISKDKKRILIVELKKGQASDSVIGQIQRYMGHVIDVLAEKDQEVHGVVIALEDDLRIQSALSATKNIEFYKYIFDFKLELLNFKLERIH